MMIKEKIKQFKKWIIAAIIGGTVLAAGEVLVNQIPADLQLKCDKADVLESYTRTFYKAEITGYTKEKNKEGIEIDVPVYENIPQYDYVEYAYKTDKKIGKLDDKEIIEERTNVIVVRNEGNGIKSQESGHSFYKQGNDWYEVKFATTSPEMFERQMKEVSLWGIVKRVFAADTGYHSPTATGGKYNKWTNPANGYVSDNVYATVTATVAKAQSYETFGFGVPAGATINGIMVSVEHYETEGTVSVWSKIYSASAAAWSNNLYATESTTEVIQELGSSSNLWGTTWIDTDFSDANFSVQWAITISETSETGNLDHIQVKVYYTEAPPLVGLPMQVIIIE